MAKNDFFVIAYRILAYLYECMKQGVFPDLNDVSYERLGIPERYWIDVIRNLYDDGYITGIIIRDSVGGMTWVAPDNPRITISGIEFLQENTSMSKAKAFLKELKEIIPGL